MDQSNNRINGPTHLLTPHLFVLCLPPALLPDFFFRDQRQSVLLEMQRQAAVAAAQQNAEHEALLAQRQQQQQQDDDNDGNNEDDEEDAEMKDAVVVDLKESGSQPSMASRDSSSIAEAGEARHRERKRRRETCTNRPTGIPNQVRPKNISSRELKSEIGRRWRALLDAESFDGDGEDPDLARYRALAREDAARHKAEMDEYRRDAVRALSRRHEATEAINEAKRQSQAQKAFQHHAQPQGLQMVSQGLKPLPSTTAALPPMMSMMTVMVNPLTGQMMPCMMMVPTASTTALSMVPMSVPMPVSMPMPTGMNATTTMSLAPGPVHEQCPAAPLQQVLYVPPLEPPAKPQGTTFTKPGPLLCSPSLQPPKPQLQGFFPSVGPSIEVLGESEDGLHKFLRTVVETTVTKGSSKVDILPTPGEIPTIHKHHGHHKRRRCHGNPSSANGSVNTTSLLQDLAKACGEDFDPTTTTTTKPAQVEIPTHISFQGKDTQEKDRTDLNTGPTPTTPYKNFGNTCNVNDSPKTQNYDSDVSGFHDLFAGGGSGGSSIASAAVVYKPDNKPNADEPIFDLTQKGSSVDNGSAATATSHAQPFFPLTGAVAPNELGFLNNIVAADIATFNKTALFHSRSKTASASAALAPSTSSKEAVDLTTTGKFMNNLQQLLQLQKEILDVDVS